MQALIAEFQQFAQKMDTTHFRLSTIFLGGGTPSLLMPAHVEALLNEIQNYFTINDRVEITMEANPGEAPFEKLRAFNDLGVNRLSMGVQSLQPELLRFMSRIHTADQAKITFEIGRAHV